MLSSHWVHTEHEQIVRYCHNYFHDVIFGCRYVIIILFERQPKKKTIFSRKINKNEHRLQL